MIMCIQNMVLISPFVFKILSKNSILTSIKGSNSVANLPKFELIQAFTHVLLTCKNHCGESKTQRKWFLDEKRDGLVEENRINNHKKEKQQNVYTPKNSFCRSNLFQTINNQLSYTCLCPEYSF